MKHSDFTIGAEFLCGDRRWRCTDIGTRVIVAICLENKGYVDYKDGQERIRKLTKEEAEAEGWFIGPPYAVEEVAFDEDDMEACEPVDAATQSAESGKDG
jgi:hypothetical protein